MVVKFKTGVPAILELDLTGYEEDFIGLSLRQVEDQILDWATEMVYDHIFVQLDLDTIIGELWKK